MGRRSGRRWVRQTPKNFYFSDITTMKEDQIILSIAEFEAMRLKHFINLNQNEAAEKMGISQPTFSRILEGAHRKTTLAILEGKTIRVYGGNVDYKVGFMGYGCTDCNHEWEDETASKEKKVDCPKCKSKNIYYLVRELI